MTNKGIQLGGGLELSNSKNLSLVDSLLNKYTKKFIAFTLAETLIVMGIIGVVAALTIPNLNSSTHNKEQVTRYKKLYAELNEAQDRAIAVYGPIETWFVGDYSVYLQRNNIYFDRLTEFLKIQKSCRDAVGNCASSEVVLSLQEKIKKPTAGYGSASYNRDAELPQAILSGGASIIRINIQTDDCTGSVNAFSGINENTNVCGELQVDTDGPNKGSNTWGIDLFTFSITKDGIYPKYRSDTYMQNYLYNCTLYGYTCGAWILKTDNMDYLLTKKDNISWSYICPDGSTRLNWDTKTSCK